MSDLPPLHSSSQTSPLRPSGLRRLAGVAGPAALLGLVVFSMIWGNNGVIARNQLRQLAEQSAVEKSREDLKYQKMIRDIELTGSELAADGSGSVGVDPVIIERLAAEELHWGKPGTVLYRFEDADPLSR